MSYQLQICINIYQGYKFIPVQNTIHLMIELLNPNFKAIWAFIRHKMYGLVVENVAAYIKVKHGKDAWENIRRLANIDTPSFSIHQVKLATFHKVV